MDLTIRPLQDDADAAAFRSLNEKWIARYFAIEAQDRRQLDDPIAAYIDTGGEILIAELDGHAVGCVALVPDGSGAYELSKMAVAPELRGRGAGRVLLTAAIDRARTLGARSLFLGSSSYSPTRCTSTNRSASSTSHPRRCTCRTRAPTCSCNSCWTVLTALRRSLDRRA